MPHNHGLGQGRLGIFSVVFFVVAAASPLTGVVGAFPVMFFVGNGLGVPGVFIMAGILLLLFSFGFVAMSRYIVNAGAFYAYIVQGLGVTWGFAGLGSVLLAYTAMQISVSSMFGFFTESFIANHWAIQFPWWGYALIMQVVVVVLGIAKVEIGGKVLGILLVLEVGVVLLLDGYIMMMPIDVEYQSFSPAVFLNGNVGISMVFAISSFIGFEATAIYSEECHNPFKVVSRATFMAVILITLFHALSSWALIQFNGADTLVANAAQNPGLFVYNISAKVLGPWSVQLMSLLLITSLFAATQAFHNSLSRYLFTMSRDQLLWSKMAHTHPQYRTPHIAGLVQGVLMLSTLFVLGSVLHFDPMIHVFAWASIVGSLAILTLQLAVSLSVIRFFRRNRQLPISIWSRLIAPALSALGMFIIIILVVQNVNALSGSSSPMINILPWLVFFFLLLGASIAQILKRKNPARYAQLGQLMKLI